MGDNGLGRGAREVRQLQDANPPAVAARVGVVVGVDGSLSVLGAVAWAGVEAARRELGLHLVQVLPQSWDAGTEPGVVHGRARALLHRAIGAVGTVVPDVPITIAPAYGSVGPALVAYAAQAQLLVVGSHGAGSVSMSPGGAVTHVSTHAACPVVVVPSEWAGSWSSTPLLGPVVVGVDGSAGGNRAVAFAAEFADRLGVDLIALTAGNRSRIEQDGPERERFASQLAGCRARHPGLTVEHRTATGRAAEALTHVTREAQLIVVGSRGRGTASGALLGSTSQELLRSSSCPVAVLSPRTPTPPGPPVAVSPASATPAEMERSGHDSGNRATRAPS